MKDRGEAEEAAPPHPADSLKLLSHSFVGGSATSETLIPASDFISLESSPISENCVGSNFGSFECSVNRFNGVCEGLLKVVGWLVGRGT